MNLGLPPIPPLGIFAGGLVLLTLLVLQILVGLRKIKFKGRQHLQVHRYIAWTLLALAVLHGFGASVMIGVLG